MSDKFTKLDNSINSDVRIAAFGGGIVEKAIESFYKWCEKSRILPDSDKAIVDFANANKEDGEIVKNIGRNDLKRLLAKYLKNDLGGDANNTTGKLLGDKVLLPEQKDAAIWLKLRRTISNTIAGFDPARRDMVLQQEVGATNVSTLQTDYITLETYLKKPQDWRLDFSKPKTQDTMNNIKKYHADKIKSSRIEKGIGLGTAGAVGALALPKVKQFYDWANPSKNGEDVFDINNPINKNSAMPLNKPYGEDDNNVFPNSQTPLITPPPIPKKNKGTLNFDDFIGSSNHNKFKKIYAENEQIETPEQQISLDENSVQPNEETIQLINLIKDTKLPSSTDINNWIAKARASKNPKQMLMDGLIKPYYAKSENLNNAIKTKLENPNE